MQDLENMSDIELVSEAVKKINSLNDSLNIAKQVILAKDETILLLKEQISLLKETIVLLEKRVHGS